MHLEGEHGVKIGIVGGTGGIGEGMALRFSEIYSVIIGSRNEEKACAMSDSTLASLRGRGMSGTCRGATNQEAVDEADIVIISVPFRFVDSTLESLSGMEEKIVVSPVNPIRKPGHFIYDPPEEGSAALHIARLLPESARVVTAFNNVAANRWKQLDEVLEYSVAVCSDDDDAKAEVMRLVETVSRLRAYDAGPLEASSLVEAVTPLLLNIARYNRMKDVGVWFR